MNRLLFALGGAAAVLVVAVLALGLYGNRPGGVGGRPSPSPSASPTAAPTAEPEPSVARPTSTPAGDLPPGSFALTQPREGEPGISVTIPASGWTSVPEFDALSKGDGRANLPEAMILLWPYPAGTDFYVYGDPCRSESTKPDNPATTVDEIVAGLAAQASRDASEPEDVTIGGYAGKSITLHVPGDAVFDECKGPEFVSFGTGTDPLSRYHQGPGQIDEFWFVDVEGVIVMIDAMYRPDTPPALVGEMRTIAESATFELP